MRTNHQLSPGLRRKSRHARATMLPARILVPINFSPESRHALKYAVSLARSSRACLILLHVAEPEIHQVDFGYGDVPRAVPNLLALKCAKLKLNSLAKGLAILHPRPLALVRIGGLQTGILAAARELRADLIVTSAKKTGVAAKADDGMVEAFVRNAPCSVLVVKKPNPAMPDWPGNRKP